MSTNRTTQISIVNSTDGDATITLYHNNSSFGTQKEAWKATPGQRVGPMTVPFKTGIGSWGVLDYWAVELVVVGGSTPGVYESSGILQYSDWKECQLQGGDVGKDLTFTVDTSTFHIDLDSGGCSTPMNLVERQTADAYVTNTTDGSASITLYHNNASDGTQSATWSATPGQRVGPLSVPFRVGLDSALILDYWAVQLVVEDGSTPGVYESSGFASMTNWKECQLQQADAGKELPLTVDTATFSVALPSGGCSASIEKVGPYAKVAHVFVLMLENHSFDNVFAFSGIPGLDVASPAEANVYDGTSYAVGSPGAPSSMPTDPGHEFEDVFTQLNGPGATHTPWTQYPTNVVNSGFVENYATTRTEITSKNPDLPTASEYGDVMKCFDTPSQLPVTQQLATEFAICDHWYASIPGPTWPNRFFVHGASSAGWADSPGGSTIAGWLLPGGGFRYPSGASIFDRLNDAKLKWRVYVDETGPTAGGVPQVAALKGITYKFDTHSFKDLKSDLQGPYPEAYTFIEPNYGDVIGGSYEGGSSQHPMDGVARGEQLIKETYEAIRNSPLWDRSMLIIAYDEHGGFYDSGAPGVAPEPNDGSPQDPKINKGGFLFDHYGVRVPAMVVSPLIPKGTVDHTEYDHASVPATLERLYDMPPMTDRDRKAKDVRHLLSLSTPRTDCPTTLTDVPGEPSVAPAEALAAPDEPLPRHGNEVGALAVVAKTDFQLARGDEDEEQAIWDRLGTIETRAHADAYISDVLIKAKVAEANRAAVPAPR